MTARLLNLYNSVCFRGGLGVVVMGGACGSNQVLRYRLGIVRTKLTQECQTNPSPPFCFYFEPQPFHPDGPEIFFLSTLGFLKQSNFVHTLPPLLTFA